MIYLKMALKNVKQSIKDYFIYFLTLSFAVCIFYSFNSIESQSAMLEMGRSTSAYMADLNTLLAGASIFVAFVLGGLIAYANNFLIRKRKRELAIYMTLGMPKAKISTVLVIETAFVGILSLLVGSLLGILVSQGLSVITARLLHIDISQYRFTVSGGALLKSVLYFGIIFLIVMILNQITIRKYKLIDMLNAAKKNEKMRLSHPLIAALVFSLSLVSLIVAYRLILEAGLNPENSRFLWAILLGIIGTLLFFFSSSSFLVHLLKRNRKLYFKDLNIFILRQINNKINTNFLSMSVISLMIFLTVTILFTMFSFKGSYDKLIEGNTDFDASVELYINSDEQELRSIQDYMAYRNFQYRANEQSVFFDVYKLDLSLNDLLEETWTAEEAKNYRDNYLDGAVSAMTLKDYNAILSLKGEQAVSLNDDEVLIISNYDLLNDALNRFMRDEQAITIQTQTYMPANHVPIRANVVTTGSYMNFLYLIVPDTFAGTLELYSSGSNVMFETDSQAVSEQRFTDFLTDVSNDMYVDGVFIPVFGHTIELVHVRIYGSTTTIVFLGVYLGIVFLVASAAVLALQQLSDISDSLDRYKSLRRIGVTAQAVDKAILSQNLIYFILPITLAICHSIVGMLVINEIFSAYNNSLIQSSSFMIALSLIIIYGSYFYATYLSSRNIVRSNM